MLNEYFSIVLSWSAVKDDAVLALFFGSSKSHYSQLSVLDVVGVDNNEEESDEKELQTKIELAKRKNTTTVELRVRMHEAIINEFYNDQFFSNSNPLLNNTMKFCNKSGNSMIPLL